MDERINTIPNISFNEYFRRLEAGTTQVRAEMPGCDVLFNPYLSSFDFSGNQFSPALVIEMDPEDPDDMDEIEGIYDKIGQILLQHGVGNIGVPDGDGNDHASYLTEQCESHGNKTYAFPGAEFTISLFPNYTYIGENIGYPGCLRLT